MRKSGKKVNKIAFKKNTVKFIRSITSFFAAIVLSVLFGWLSQNYEPSTIIYIIIFLIALLSALILYARKHFYKVAADDLVETMHSKLAHKVRDEIVRLQYKRNGVDFLGEALNLKTVIQDYIDYISIFLTEMLGADISTCIKIFATNDKDGADNLEHELITLIRCKRTDSSREGKAMAEAKPIKGNTDFEWLVASEVYNDKYSCNGETYYGAINLREKYEYTKKLKKEKRYDEKEALIAEYEEKKGYTEKSTETLSKGYKDAVEFMENNQEKYDSAIAFMKKFKEDYGKKIYENSNDNFSDYYDSTLIVPIRHRGSGDAKRNGKTIKAKKEPQIIGFLCVDSPEKISEWENKNSFSHHFLSICTDILYLYFNQLRSKSTNKNKEEKVKNAQ